MMIEQYIKDFIIQRVKFVKEFMPLFVASVKQVARKLGTTFVLSYEYPLKLTYSARLDLKQFGEILDIELDDWKEIKTGGLWTKAIRGRGWWCELVVHLKDPDLYIRLRKFKLKGYSKSTSVMTYSMFADFHNNFPGASESVSDTYIKQRVGDRFEKMVQKVIGRYKVVSP